MFSIDWGTFLAAILELSDSCLISKWLALVLGVCKVPPFCLCSSLLPFLITCVPTTDLAYVLFTSILFCEPYMYWLWTLRVMCAYSDVDDLLQVPGYKNAWLQIHLGLCYAWYARNVGDFWHCSDFWHCRHEQILSSKDTSIFLFCFLRNVLSTIHFLYKEQGWRR